MPGGCEDCHEVRSLRPRLNTLSPNTGVGSCQRQTDTLVAIPLQSLNHIPVHFGSQGPRHLIPEPCCWLRTTLRHVRGYWSQSPYSQQMKTKIIMNYRAGSLWEWTDLVPWLELWQVPSQRNMHFSTTRVFTILTFAEQNAMNSGFQDPPSVTIHLHDVRYPTSSSLWVNGMASLKLRT